MGANNTKLTEQEIHDIVSGYKEGMSIREIAEATGRSDVIVAKYLERQGVRKIEHRKPTQPVKSEVKCPNCRATGHYKGAKFCYKCGADIRTESDILRERLGKLVADIQFLPDSVRDNFYTVIQETCDYLRKVG